MRIGIIAALPGELKPLVRGWQKLPVARGSGIAMWQTDRGGNQVVAVCAGMGTAAALRAFTAAEHTGTLDYVFSVGWAGALTAEANPGFVYNISQIIDVQTGERFQLHQHPEGAALVTLSRVADATEKLRLAASYGATVVDMEAAAVARLAQMRDIEILCFKAVSDGLDASLPDLNPFIDLRGHLKMASFLAHVAARPKYWPHLIALGQNSSKAARALAQTIERHLGLLAT